MLGVIVPLASASSTEASPPVQVSINGSLLYLSNGIVSIKMNLTSAASIEYYAVLGSALYNCSVGYPGFHIAAVRSDVTKPAEQSSLAKGPWSANVLENTTERVVIALKPSSEALEDISPLNLTMILTLTRGQSLPIFTIILENPSNDPIQLKSYSLDNETLGLEFLFKTCTEEPHKWLFSAGYMTSSGPHIVTLENPNGTSPSEFFPANSTFIGALNYYVENSTPTMVEVLESSSLSYYTAYKDATGNIVLKAFTNEIIVAPHSRITITVRAGLLLVKPALLYGVTSASLLPLIDSSVYPQSVEEEANHDKIVKNLTSQIDSLRSRLNNTISQLDNCQKSKNNLTEKINELRELLDTCKIDKDILKNQTAKLRHNLDSASLKIAVFSTISLLVGVAGGYLIRQRK